MLDYSKNTKAVRITAELLHVKQLLLKAQNGHWLRSTCDSLNETSFFFHTLTLLQA